MKQADRSKVEHWTESESRNCHDGQEKMMANKILGFHFEDTSHASKEGCAGSLTEELKACLRVGDILLVQQLPSQIAVRVGHAWTSVTDSSSPSF